MEDLTNILLNFILSRFNKIMTIINVKILILSKWVFISYICVKNIHLRTTYESTIINILINHYLTDRRGTTHGVLYNPMINPMN